MCRNLKCNLFKHKLWHIAQAHWPYLAKFTIVFCWCEMTILLQLLSLKYVQNLERILKEVSNIASWWILWLNEESHQVIHVCRISAFKSGVKVNLRKMAQHVIWVGHRSHNVVSNILMWNSFTWSHKVVSEESCGYVSCGRGNIF